MEEKFKQIAALIGDPTRATIMWTLLDGRAFTATELAMAAGTSPQNMSTHLAKLMQAGLLSAESQGRHRYYRFSRMEVAYAIEAMASLLPAATGKGGLYKDAATAIRQCRTCYDHLAGSVGVAITDSLLKQQLLLEGDAGFTLSTNGGQWFTALGVDVAALQQQRRPLLRPCLDWSERRRHMAGALPAALLDKMLLDDWLRRTKNSRAIVVTARGRAALYEHFKLNVS